MSRTWRAWPLVGAVFFVASCQGDGSDIGPRLTPLPEASNKVSVYNDQNRGVVVATVSLIGTSIGAITGRNGRGELFANPSGRILVQVDGAAAAAVDGDLLGTLTSAVTITGRDMPTVFYLPDCSASAVLPINVGTQAAQVSLSNPLGSGGILTILAGTSVGLPGGASTVTLRSTSLKTEHLPGDRPGDAPILMTRGFYIDPPDVTFSPGAGIDVSDDLSATGSVTLYRLDASTGEWTGVGDGIAGGGVIRSSGVITSGGLYAFGITAAVAAQVSGRVVYRDEDDVIKAAYRSLVNVDGLRTVCADDGTFVVDMVPAVTADGSPRSAVIEVSAGGDWLPSISTDTVAMNGANAIDVGDIELDTLLCGNIRIQQIKRARAEDFRSAGVSSLYGAVALSGMTDENGQVTFEDVPSEWFGFQNGYPKDDRDVFYAQAVGFSENGRRWLDAFQFYDELAWFIGSRSSRILVTDSIGGGPIYEASIVQGEVGSSGWLGETREGGVAFADRSLAGRVTATYESASGSDSTVHAFTIVEPNGEHIELPVQQALRQPLGAFDRHGIVSGDVTMVSGGTDHRLRTTRRLEIDDWWMQAAEDVPIRSALPIDVDPAVTNGAYRAGVDAVGGNLVAAEVTTAGVVTLQKLAIDADLTPIEGAVIERDLPLEYSATESFAAPGVLTALDASIAVGDLAFDLALEQPSGRVVDCVQDIDGNHVVNGADITLTLPPLTGSIADHGWLAMIGGSATVASGTITQKCMLRFSGTAVASAARLLPAPTILAPAPGAVVSSSGFTVQFSLPPDTQYATLELRSQSGGELLLWDVVIPPSDSVFSFVLLPPEAETPLRSGKSYTLKLSAYAASGGPLINSDDAYRDLTTFLQSVGAAERGVDAVSTRSVQITSS